MSMIRVFFVDDHTLLRSGLRPLLARPPGLQVVDEAGNGLELPETALTRRETEVLQLIAGGLTNRAPQETPRPYPLLSDTD
ncbi:response regulator transcription factor [Hymenobacter terricola]|uniref:response regulator transcription factor n=1 Tax=Hymenobacter terricola TaxID=2819236 RepID=UPI001B30BC25|nr:hypothetical protein [Hymenobacter terricola]